MLNNLVHLLEIRRDMQTKVKVLQAAAESDSRLAYPCELLAQRCRQLDGAIEAFVAATLESQVPQGHA